MFGNLGVHLNKFPSNRYGFVGTLPTVLADIVPANKSDAMGGRAWIDDNGELKTYKFPTFETAEEAKAYAKSKNVDLITYHLDKDGNKIEIS